MKKFSDIIREGLNRPTEMKKLLFHLRDDKLLTGPLIGSAGIALHTGKWDGVNDIDILGPVPSDNVKFDEKYERGYLTNFYKTKTGTIVFEYIPELRISGKKIKIDLRDVTTISGIKVLGLEQLKQLKSQKKK